MAGADTLKKTPLHEVLAGSGRFIEFAGWTMPVEFAGIVAEHKAVRTHSGMFDLSHMGELEVRGTGAQDVVQRLVTNDVSRLEPGAALYSPVCRADGNILDDILVYRFPDHFMLVVNASNIDKMTQWFGSHARGDAQVKNKSDDYALIALQGPQAEPLLQPLTKHDLSTLKYYHFAEAAVADVPLILSRTGYTGEDGFELYVAPDKAAGVWKRIAEVTKSQPIGLGARDTLRLECRYALYGNDIDETTNPVEAGLSWTIRWDKGEFIGREALLAVKTEGVSRHLVGFKMEESGIGRHGYPVKSLEGVDLGYITSGTFSPTMDEALGLAYIRAGHHSIGTELDVVIRNRTARARVAKTPFYKGSVKR
ncbi:MAG TPA: glycine cleavage system aminomethyltransferase GcvT [Candidatus Xenobia bacterium]|jgi:aminomethyltransferase